MSDKGVVVVYWAQRKDMQMQQIGSIEAARGLSSNLSALGSELRPLSLLLLSLLLFHAILSPSMAAPAGKLEHPQTFPRTMRHLLDDNNSSNVGNQTLSETTSTVTLATMIDGYMTSNASVMNNSVFIDTSAPFSPETTAAPTTTTTTTTPTASSNTAQLPVGAVVIASETLTLPAEAVLQSQGFTMQFKSSSFANVGANIPAGAWPKDDRRVPTLQVVSLNLTAANISLPAQSRVGGPVIEYGPSGIKFLLPVRLALPISNTTVLGSSEELVVHVYNQSTFMWERRPVLSKNVPTPPAGIVSAGLWGNAQLLDVCGMKISA
eukprot:346951-Hanusia_phi.AAC.1